MVIDVIIATYNRLWALKRSMPFYLKQKIVNLVIIVDDASIDGTKEWIKRNYSSNPRVKYVRHPFNRGCSAARITGSLYCEAPLIFFADDDMILEPANGLSIMESEMERNKGDIITPIVILSEESLPINISFNEKGRNGHSLFNTILEFKSTRRLVNDVNGETFECFTLRALMLIRRDVLNKIHYNYDLGISGFREETDFQLKAHNAGFRLLACPKVFLIDFNKKLDKGGCRNSMNRFRYEFQACRNNWRFLITHKFVLKRDLKVQLSIEVVQALFVINHFARRIRVLSKLISLLPIYQ